MAQLSLVEAVIAASVSLVGLGAMQGASLEQMTIIIAGTITLINERENALRDLKSGATGYNYGSWQLPTRTAAK